MLLHLSGCTDVGHALDIATSSTDARYVEDANPNVFGRLQFHDEHGNASSSFPQISFRDQSGTYLLPRTMPDGWFFARLSPGKYVIYALGARDSTGDGKSFGCARSDVATGWYDLDTRIAYGRLEEEHFATVSIGGDEVVYLGTIDVRITNGRSALHFDRATVRQSELDPSSLDTLPPQVVKRVSPAGTAVSARLHDFGSLACIDVAQVWLL